MTVLLPGRFSSVAETDAVSRKQVRRRRKGRRKKAGVARKCVTVQVPWGEHWVPLAVLALPVPAGLWGASPPHLPPTLSGTSPLSEGFVFSFPFFPLIREAFNKKLRFVNHFV